jgi:hypothetical protein
MLEHKLESRVLGKPRVVASKVADIVAKKFVSNMYLQEH